MTVGKGSSWGEPGVLPADGVVARTDAEASGAIASARLEGTAPPVLGLVGGDLARTVGAGTDAERLRSGPAHRAPVDVGEVTIGSRTVPFLAHVIIRRRWWIGSVIAVMNAQFIGPWDVAPRSHPGDGLLDVFETDLGLNEKLKVRERLPSGSHVPHPSIRQGRVRAQTFTVPAGAHVWIDGVDHGRATSVSVAVVPDGVEVVF